jgi:hypothetical protein
MRPGMGASGANNEQTAVATHSPTAAETSFTTVAATLPGGAVGIPKYVDCSGNVAGIIQVAFGSQANKAVSIAPNQLPTRIMIPPGAFPNKPNSVNIQFQGFAAGTMVAVVTFQVG